MGTYDSSIHLLDAHDSSIALRRGQDGWLLATWRGWDDKTDEHT